MENILNKFKKLNQSQEEKTEYVVVRRTYLKLLEKAEEENVKLKDIIKDLFEIMRKIGE